MKKKLSLTLFAIFMIISFFYGYRFYIAEPVLLETHGIFGFDVGDDNELINEATHVFVGKVIENKGTMDDPGSLKTLYSVDVMTNIKGETPEQVDIRQLGGYGFHLPTATKYWTGREGEKPYEEGKVYLFITLNVNDVGYYTPFGGIGTLPINDQNHQKELVDTYKEIHKENLNKENLDH